MSRRVCRAPGACARPACGALSLMALVLALPVIGVTNSVDPTWQPGLYDDADTDQLVSQAMSPDGLLGMALVALQGLLASASAVVLPAGRCRPAVSDGSGARAPPDRVAGSRWSFFARRRLVRSHRARPTVHRSPTWAQGPRRSALVVILALGLLAAPLAGQAQQPRRVYRIGRLGGFAIDEPLREGLRALGYVEGQNLVIEARFARERGGEVYPALAAELVALRVALIVCPSTDACAAARKATGTVPIVMSGAANPLAEGLVASLARPGGNVTGSTVDTAEVTAKRLELLSETLPGLRRVAAFYPEAARTFSVVAQWLRDTEAAARRLGLALELVDLDRYPEHWDAVLDGVRRRGIRAAVIMETPPYWNGRARLAELGIKHRLAVLVPSQEYAAAGGLISYGADVDEVHRRAASIVDRILKGARPEDIPVELPTRFPLIINLKTARALGLTIPPAVLARADEVVR